MRLVNRSTVLGTTLVALAILNFSVLDQIGVGLVSSVHDKFEDLGADWIALQAVGSEADLEYEAQQLRAVGGVEGVMASWSLNQVTMTEAGPSGVEWLVPSAQYDLATSPFLFVFQEEPETGAEFYRDRITWLEGRPPQGSEFAASLDYVQDAGLRVGDVVTHTFGGNPATGQGGTSANLTLVGLYDRAYTDDSGQAFDIVILGRDSDVGTAIRNGTLGNARGTLLVNGDMASILATSDAVVDSLEAAGYVVSTEEFRIGGRMFGGRGGFGGPPPGGFGGQGGPGGGAGGGPGAGFQPGGPGGGGGQQLQTPDFRVYANGDILESSLDAAERAGLWFRMLTTSAVVMALVGIAFVTASMERKIRRDVGIRQAVGFPANRVYMHWATVALAMGLVGGVTGVAIVYAISAAGLGGSLLGVPLIFQASTGAVLAPVAAVLVYGLATFPTYWRVLRSAPAVNLRALSE